MANLPLIREKSDIARKSDADIEVASLLNVMIRKPESKSRDALNIPAPYLQALLNGPMHLHPIGA